MRELSSTVTLPIRTTWDTEAPQCHNDDTETECGDLEQGQGGEFNENDNSGSLTIDLLRSDGNAIAGCSAAIGAGRRWLIKGRLLDLGSTLLFKIGNNNLGGILGRILGGLVRGSR